MKSYGSLNEKFVLQGEIVTKEVRLKLRREKNTKKTIPATGTPNPFPIC